MPSPQAQSWDKVYVTIKAPSDEGAVERSETEGEKTTPQSLRDSSPDKGSLLSVSKIPIYRTDKDFLLYDIQKAGLLLQSGFNCFYSIISLIAFSISSTSVFKPLADIRIAPCPRIITCSSPSLVATRTR